MLYLLFSGLYLKVQNMCLQLPEIKIVIADYQAVIVMAFVAYVGAVNPFVHL